ncbi:uncharacterized protein TNCV_4828381 [Trichonephila clavipes]|uniref:Uncharacterized protein n=1 Tax=Trichonephila clavipes TaxID=2585209 RepID=A0A8X6SN56_TRICX|nr:uncharacterized protein TNCV_4828381 [Trichonephila clavipes]
MANMGTKELSPISTLKTSCGNRGRRKKVWRLRRRELANGGRREGLSTVQRLLQPGSMLFFMDYSTPFLIKTHEFNLDDMYEYNLLYKTTSNLHTLDEVVLERFFCLYYDKFHLSHNLHTYHSNDKSLAEIPQNGSS